MATLCALFVTGCTQAGTGGPDAAEFAGVGNGLVIYGDGDIAFADPVPRRQGHLVGMPGDGLVQSLPDVSPNGRQLAHFSYSEFDGNQPEVVVTEIDASGQPSGDRRFPVEDRVQIDHLAWSPDGKSLSYVAQPWAWGAPVELRLISVSDGTGITLLSARMWISDVAWSPDGSSLGVVSNGAVWLVPTDGADPTRLTQGFSAGEIAWSPDGALIAFSADSPGPEMEPLPPHGISASPKGIHVMRADGTEQRLLTQGFRDLAPAWSPDGRRIVFVRFTCTQDSCGVLTVMGRDGSDVVDLRLPDETELLWPFEDVGYSLGFSWSPDSSMITYIASQVGEERGVIVSSTLDSNVVPVLLSEVDLRRNAGMRPRFDEPQNYRREVDWQPLFP